MQQAEGSQQGMWQGASRCILEGNASIRIDVAGPFSLDYIGRMRSLPTDCCSAWRNGNPTVFNRLLLSVRSRPMTYALMGLGILLLDLVTGRFLMFSILFVVPVALSGWFSIARFAYALAILLPAGRFLIAAVVDQPKPLVYTAADAIIRVAVLCLVAFLAIRARQTAALRERVRMLEGILPTCSFCKKIRDDNGKWTQIESYISSHSQAQFSHGLCPTCAQKHYGDILNSPKDA